jgi:hypothetical protein
LGQLARRILERQLYKSVDITAMAKGRGGEAAVAGFRVRLSEARNAGVLKPLGDSKRVRAMTDMAAFIAQIVALNGGALTGKTRLRKTAYFLERKGLGYGFDFEYHYYGPYSEEVAIAANDARARDLIGVEKALTQRGDAYSVYRLHKYDLASENVVDAGAKRQVLRTLSEYSAVVIELAATADFLEASGHSDPWPETRLRKSAKATPERIDLAKQLLVRLGEFKNANVFAPKMF